MSLLVKITLAAALILSIAVPSAHSPWARNPRGATRGPRLQHGTVLGVMAVSAGLMFTGNAYAAEEAASAVSSSATGFGYLAAALSTGLSCVGGGIAVSAAASAALGAISEDSSILGKSLIFVGLAEGVCLYGLIISFNDLGTALI